MKTNLFLIALGAASLAACTSEDVVSPVDNAPAGSDQPIAFTTAKANQGRAVDHVSGLETVCYDFGVWAYKTDENWTHTATAAADGDMVMANYLVGYWDGTSCGYKPTGSQTLPDGSNWYYEKLGNDDDGFNFHNSAVQGAASTANEGSQYLKYWDLSKDYVNFYACAPYGAATAFTPDTRKMEFKALTLASGEELMYGCASVTSANGAAGTKVPIQFRRLSSQIRLAFYSELEGYTVDLINFSGASSSDGIICMASYKDGESYKTAAAAGKGYVSSCEPIVTWGISGNESADVTFTNPTLATANIFCPIDFKDKLGSSTTTLGTSYANRIFGPCYRVLPYCKNPNNCGFTVNVSFKLTATDSGEVIYVYGAKAYVGDDKTEWLPNKLYTYVFKVTKDLPGTTDDTTTPVPGVTPPAGALHPIEFDNVNVEDIDFVEQVYGEFNL